MAEPVLPGALTPLTPQIPIDSGIAAVSTNRRVHFDETVTMVEQLNVELPKTHQNAVSASESAAAANTSRTASEIAKTGAEAARAQTYVARDEVLEAAAGVLNPVSRDDKATQTDANNGTANKWVDASILRWALGSYQPVGSYVTTLQFNTLQAEVSGKQPVGDYATKNGTESLTNKTLGNAKEVFTSLGSVSVVDPRANNNASLTPAANVTFSVGANTSNADLGRSAVYCITPSANITFATSPSVRWPNGATPPSMTSGRTYVVSLVNMPVGANFLWLANLTAY